MKRMFIIPETDKALWTDMAAYGIILFVAFTVLPPTQSFLDQFGGKMNLIVFQVFGYGLVLQTLRILRDLKR